MLIVASLSVNFMWPQVVLAEGTSKPTAKPASATKTIASSAIKSVARSANISDSGAMPLYAPFILDLRILRKGIGDYQREPNNQLAFFDAARYYLGVRKYNEAEKLARSALLAHPKWASPNYVLAKVAEAQLEDMQCLEYYQQALKLSPHWLDAAIAYADKLNASEKYSESVAVSASALRYCAGLPKSAGLLQYMRNLRFCKAQALYNCKDFSGAAREMEVDSANLSDDIRLKFLAECYLKSKQWTKALAVANRLVRGKPNNFNFHLLRAQIYSETGQPQRAIDDLSTCLQLKRFSLKDAALATLTVVEERDVRLLRAAMYEKIGKKDLAKKDRAAIKEVTERTYKETVFRTRS